MNEPRLTHFAEYLIQTFEKNKEQDYDKKISVNPVISKVATWYEKIRNAMDYREEEVILRAAIERILKRRVLLGGTGKTIAEPLVRELVWAKIFPDETLSESVIEKVEKQISLYLKLRELILSQKKTSEKVINEWTYHLLSSAIENIMHPHYKRQSLSSFMFQVLKDNVNIEECDEQTKDAQVFIAIRKNFNKDDVAFLRYHLFNQYFGSLKEENIENVAKNFFNGYKEIQKQLNHPIKERVYNYVKKKTGVFFVLEDLLRLKKGELRTLYKDETEFKKTVFSLCNARYSGIRSKVKTAIIRSVIFILLTKAFFAFGVEGTFESMVFGRVIWSSLLMNLFIPPILMIIVGLSIKTPGKDNSERIFSHIKTLLFEDRPKIGNSLIIKKQKNKKSTTDNIFTLLWFITYLIAFGMIVFVLTKLHFNVVSQAVFTFFIAIVSFFSYRISQSANVYTVEAKSGVWTTVGDFLFMPFIQVGRKLTEGISQVNLILFILDFAIETPFKGLFAFFEQWFLFLQAKREKLE
ncbi:MAG: hypothetical protein M1426_02745 [Patescibacteria group bacterium]|nr:hypothetical protein [Patescibacteria group bacterium]